MQLFNLDSGQYADLLAEPGVRVLQALDCSGLLIDVIEGGRAYGDCLGIFGSDDRHVIIQTNMNDECGGSIHDNARALERAR